MANEYQEAFLSAIEVVAGNIVDQLATDKTVTATIVASTNALTNEYLVSYSGGEMYAYANEGASYSENTTVYVLVPEGDFTNKKIIIGRATLSGDDENISFISSALSNYNLIGNNTILDKNGVLPLGLFSYLATDEKVLYQYGDEENSLLQIDIDALTEYIKEAETVLIEADFKTRLPREHRINSKGSYGLEFILAFKDRNSTDINYDKYLSIAPQIKDALLDYRDQLLNIWSDPSLTVAGVDIELPDGTIRHEDGCRDKTKEVLDSIEQFRTEQGASLTADSINAISYILNSEIKNLIPLEDGSSDTLTKEQGYEIVDTYFVTNYKEKTIAIYKDPSLTLVEQKGLVQALVQTIKNYLAENQTTLAEEYKQAFVNFEAIASESLNYSHAEEAIEYINSQVTVIKLSPYTLDIDGMTGNPYSYLNWTSQYGIFPIDVENFLYIDSIRIFSQGFETEDNPKYLVYGADIFIDNIEFYGLKTITSVNGDYKLRLDFPDGQIFKVGNLDSDSLRVLGVLNYLDQNLSDSATYYWFKEDARVDNRSKHWQAFGGAGWYWLEDKGNKYQLEIEKRENRAYENKYLCVSVYKEQLILKAEFTIKNDSERREITIESDMGTEFNFDIGSPTLTCFLNGKKEEFEKDLIPTGRPDDYFQFIWSKVDEFNQVTSYTKSYEQLKQEYEDLYNKFIEQQSSSEEIPEDERITFDQVSSAKNKMDAMEGIVFDKNVIKIGKISGILNRVTYKCSVYVKDHEDDTEFYNIGSAEIILQNADVVVPSDYYILITNGDQVFQYSESGVTPASERYADPLEILPLQCHFYSPTGLEITQTAYTLKWKVPLENTMLTIPTEGMIQNPANGLYEWYSLREYPLGIAESYDYQALNNQVTALVTYEGKEFSQETTLLFVKVGDNGTNGTDVVCRISPLDEPDDSLLAIEMNVTKTADGSSIVATSPPTWNNPSASTLSNDMLQFRAYNRNELIALDRVDWSMAGNQYSSGKNMSVSAGISDIDTASVNYGLNLNEKGLSTQVVRGHTYITITNSDASGENTESEYDATVRQDYYAFYPVPTILYRDAPGYIVKLDKAKTLKYVTYNADGRNPLYNKNQGVFFTLTARGEPLPQELLKNKYVTYDVQGGVDDNAETASIGLRQSKNGKIEVLDPDTNAIINTIEDPISDHKEGKLINIPQIYVVPDDVYSGAYCNNNVIVTIYTDENTYRNNNQTGNNYECKFTIPIQMSLNCFGLASLNAWDGNHIEINEDGNYILAPQIGAGTKDTNNRFTGLVMGTAQTYDQDRPQIGLLGYNKGEQSIWMDSETGKTILGLPEVDKNGNNRYTEGRIELVPGGISKIGMWHIGSRALWNIPKPDANDSWKLEDYEYYEINEGKYDDIETNYTPEDAQIKVPEKAQGILINADPSYISIKGRPLTVDDDITFSISAEGVPNNQKSGRSILYPTDSLELQLDPNQGSIFSIFQHTQLKNVEDNVDVEEQNDWVRVLRVGIDAYGRFFTNALKDSSVGIAPGYVAAFGKSVDDKYYYGLTVETGEDVRRSNTLIKLFTDTAGEDIVYISSARDSGGESDGEYNRPLQLYGNEIILYSGSGISETSNNKISIHRNGDAYVGNGQSYFRIVGTNTEITSERNLNINADRDISISSVDGDMSVSIPSGDISNILGGNFSVSSSRGNISLTTTNGSGIFSVTDNINIVSSSGSGTFSANDNISITSVTGNGTFSANDNIVISGTTGTVSVTSGDSTTVTAGDGINLSGGHGSVIQIDFGGTDQEILLNNGLSSIRISDEIGTALDNNGNPTNGINFAGNTRFQNTVSFEAAAKHYADASFSEGRTIWGDTLVNGYRSLPIRPNILTGDIYIEDHNAGWLSSHVHTFTIPAGSYSKYVEMGGASGDVTSSAVISWLIYNNNTSGSRTGSGSTSACTAAINGLGSEESISITGVTLSGSVGGGSTTVYLPETDMTYISSGPTHTSGAYVSTMPHH